MPELALLADNGGIVTVSPEWCDWYELVFNQPAGTGYIKGREIMQQIDRTFSEFFTKRSEAVKSAIHSMMANDPNRPIACFSTIDEARNSMELAGKHAMDFDDVEKVFTFDGYFSVKDMEAILFIRRATDLIAQAKEEFGGVFAELGNNIGAINVNHLMQVMNPRHEVVDVHSDIFAAPVDAASYFGGSPNRAAMMGGKVMAENMKPIHQQLAERASPMAERFNSIVEAKAVLTESGVLAQNLTRAVNGSFHIEGYFTPKDLEAILYLYRNNDPMVFPEKDANGKPEDGVHLNDSRSIWNSLSGKPAPEGFNINPPELNEGDILQRTHISSDGRVLHIAYDANGDQAFYQCTKQGNLLVVAREPKGTRGNFTGYPYKLADMHGDRGVICEVWSDDQKPPEGMVTEAEIIIGQDSIDRRIESSDPESAQRKANMRWNHEVLMVYMAFGLEHAMVTHSYMVRKVQEVVDVPERDIRVALGYELEPDSIKRLGLLNELCKRLTAAGKIIPISDVLRAGLDKLYDAAMENPSAAKALRLSTGDDLEKKLHAEIVGGGLRRGEFMAISAETPASKTQVALDENHDPQRLDVTGRTLPKFILTDLAGGNSVEKDLTILREMDADDLSESMDWIIKGYPLSERDDERFVGFTIKDFIKVAAERIKQLQSDNFSLQSDVSSLQHQIDN
jgi:hypothetical protein